MGDPAVRGEELAAFGRWLVRERELRGLARDDVIRATKLAPAVIEALESGEEGRIPPRAYVVGYLRAYAQAVGLDADDVVLRFQEAAGAAPVRAAAPGSLPKVPPRVALAAAVVAVVIAALVLWALFAS